MPEQTLVKESGEKSCKCSIVPHRTAEPAHFLEKVVLLKSTGPDPYCISIGTGERASSVLYYTLLAFYRQRKKGLGDENESRPPPRKHR